MRKSIDRFAFSEYYKSLTKYARENCEASSSLRNLTEAHLIGNVSNEDEPDSDDDDSFNSLMRGDDIDEIITGYEKIINNIKINRLQFNCEN